MTSRAAGWQPDPDRTDCLDLAPARIVGIGASCDLEPPHPDGPHIRSYSVSEFVTLADGRRVILHAERGFTSGMSSPRDLRDHETPDSVTRSVLTTVLPDDDEPVEDHPWEWLAELARARGLAVTADQLRCLDYEVELSERLRQWLS